jgi:hypothetical protein
MGAALVEGGCACLRPAPGRRTFMIKPEWAGFMIAGSFGRYLAQTARDHGSGVGSGAESAAAGREQRLRFQGLAARRSLTQAVAHKSRTHVPSVRPQQRLDHAQGGLPAVPSTASCPRLAQWPVRINIAFAGLGLNVVALSRRR